MLSWQLSSGKSPSSLRFSVKRPIPSFTASAGLPMRAFAPRTRISPPVPALGAVNDPPQHVLTGAQQPGEARDLAGVNIAGNVVN